MKKQIEYFSLEEMKSIASLEDLSKIGWPNYFVNCIWDVFSFCYMRCKLNQNDLNEIRDKYDTGKYSLNELAKQYNVSWTTISKIVSDKLHKDYRKLIPHPNDRGYYTVTLRKNGKGYSRKVAHLVLGVFTRLRLPKEQCCHGPSGKGDNCLNNLSWGTASKNQGEDRVRDGTSNRGERCAASKLTKEKVVEIRNLYANGGMLQREIAAIYGVARETIVDIVNRRTWKHIP